MRYLTATHERPPRHITTAAGSIIPTQVLIDRDDEIALNTAGLYKHVTVEGPAPLGYTNWALIDGQYVREPAGTDEEKFEALKEQKRAQLYAQRVQAEKSPFQHTDGRWYDGSDDSIERFGVVAQQITWALMGGVDPTTEVIAGGWRDLNDVGGPSTIADLQALLQSHYAHGVACELNSQALKAQINAATTIVELDAVDLTVGWPQP